MGVERSELNWSWDSYANEYVLEDSQDQEYNAFVNAVLLWKEIRGSQTNEELDGLAALYDQGGSVLKDEVISRYSEYAPYYKD